MSLQVAIRELRDASCRFGRLELFLQVSTILDAIEAYPSQEELIEEEEMSVQGEGELQDGKDEEEGEQAAASSSQDRPLAALGVEADQYSLG